MLLALIYLVTSPAYAGTPAVSPTPSPAPPTSAEPPAKSAKTPSSQVSPSPSPKAIPSPSPSPSRVPSPPPAPVSNASPPPLAQPQEALVRVSSANRDLWRGGLAIERLEGSMVHFKPVAGGPGKPLRLPSPVETGLFDITYLGAIQSSDALPVLLMIGRPCTNCSEEKQIYAVRVDGTRSTHFVFPGKILDPKSRAVLFESRAFYGRCLPRYGDAYVVFQRERIDRKRALQTSVFVASPSREFLEETLLERHMPGIKNTLMQVKKRQCWEILGRNRLMLRKKIDLRPRRPGDGPAPSDDDDDDTESSQDAETAGESNGPGRD